MVEVERRADRKEVQELAVEIAITGANIEHLAKEVTTLSSDIKGLAKTALIAQADSQRALQQQGIADKRTLALTELVIRHDQRLKKKIPWMWFAIGGSVLGLFLMFNYNPIAAMKAVSVIKDW